MTILQQTIARPEQRKGGTAERRNTAARRPKWVGSTAGRSRGPKPFMYVFPQSHAYPVDSGSSTYWSLVPPSCLSRGVWFPLLIALENTSE